MIACPECRKRFERRRIDQGYCSIACSRLGDARELRRARTLYRGLYWWRKDRKNGASHIGFICREIAAWIKEDEASQRGGPPRPTYHLKDLGLQSRRLERRSEQP